MSEALPPGWNRVPLKDAAHRITDGTHQTPHFTERGVPFLVISNVISGEIDWTSVRKWISRSTYEDLTVRIRPEFGDVLYTAVGSYGVAVPIVENRDFAFQRHIAHIKPNPNLVDFRYLTYFLNSEGSRRYADSVARGVAQKTVTLGDLAELPLVLPPIDEQRRIAAILDKADAIRRKRQQALALADDFLRSVFLEMFGDPVSNPKNWRVVPLELIAKVNSGLTKGRNIPGKNIISLPYMRVANVQDGFIDLSDVKNIELDETEVSRYLLNQGDVLLTEGGDPDKLGRGAVWNCQIVRCVHQNHIFRVSCNYDQANPNFVSAQLGSSRGKRYFLRSAKQTTGIATINKTQLNAFPLLLPPIDQQNEYARHVKRVAQWKENLTQAHQLSGTLFASLSQRAFRGDL